MNIPSWLLLDTYSLFLLIIILTVEIQRKDRRGSKGRAYFRIVLLAIILLAADMGSRITVRTTAQYYGAVICNYLIFLLDMPVSLLWLQYANQWILDSRLEYKKENDTWYNGVLLFVVINSVLVTLSLRFGWFFYYDAARVYHRGAFFNARALAVAIVFIFSVGFVLSYRKYLGHIYVLPMALFSLIPLLCGILQVKSGLNLEFTGITVSLLIVYFYMQNRELNTDYLTGAGNRREFDTILEERIRQSAQGKEFSAMMIDIDHFKQINDRYGHKAGDQILADAVVILRRSFRSEDVISRYGGDEFCVITGIRSTSGLEASKGRIESNLERYNASSKIPCRLSFSIGYAVYDPASGMSAKKFLEQIDSKMYADKKNNRTREQSGGIARKKV